MWVYSVFLVWRRFREDRMVSIGGYVIGVVDVLFLVRVLSLFKGNKGINYKVLVVRKFYNKVVEL